MGRTSLASCCALFLASALLAQDDLVRTTAAVRIMFTPGRLPAALAERLADEARDEIEGAWPTIRKALRLRDDDAFTLHLHGQPDSFRKLERAYRPDKLEGTLAVGPHGEGAHVLVYPLSVRVLEQIGMPKRTRQDLVHALASQIAMERMGEKADAWIADVIGLGVMELAVNPDRSGVVDARWDSRRVEAGWGKKSQGEIVSVLSDLQAPATRERMDIRQAWRAVLAEQMSRRSASWAVSLMRAWPGARDGTVYGKDRFAAVEAVLGKDWARTQKRFEQTMSRVEVGWTASAPAVWLDGEDLVFVGNKELHAHTFDHDPLPEGDYRISFSAQLETSAEMGEFRLLLDWNGKDLLGVFFGEPGVRVRVYSGDKWHDRAASDHVPTPGALFDVRVESRDNSLFLHVDGRLVVEIPVASRGMHGIWGFAASDSITRVRGIKVESIKRRGR